MVLRCNLFCTAIAFIMGSCARPLLERFNGIHVKCRNSLYSRSKELMRFPVSDAHVSWSVDCPGYKPVQFTHPSITGASFADKESNDPNFKPQWNRLDGNIDRRSFMGTYEIKDGRPLNPMGRTGISGRGALGKWGPNHAADPIVTRWKRDSHGAVLKHNNSGKPILEFVAIVRGDTKEWAIPGGMVDAGEQVSATLKREFGEEALNSLTLSEQQKHQLHNEIEELFKHGIEVYRGYVDDPRNTDNAWMETVAVNVHDDDGTTVARVNLQAGDDAVGVEWKELSASLQLYASHLSMVEAVTHFHKAHWN